MNQQNECIHPGLYIRDQIIPPAMPVKVAAKLLGVGRPALSNLLNGNASLSPEMAARFEKAFGADQRKLLKLQAEFDQHQQRARAQTLAVRAYVPSFLKITARDLGTMGRWESGSAIAPSCALEKAR